MCQERIEAYDRTEGSTHRVTRFACNLPTTVADVAVVQGKFYPVATDRDHLEKLISAIASKDVSGNVDPSITTMTPMWKRPDPPRPEVAPQGNGDMEKYFECMIRDGIWEESVAISQGKTYFADMATKNKF